MFSKIVSLTTLLALLVSLGATLVSPIPLNAASPSACQLTWELVPSPTSGAGGDSLTAIDGAAANDIWAAGTTSGNNPILLQHWNGTAWSLATAPDIGIGTNALTISALVMPAANEAWIAGYYGLYGSETPFVLRWNGLTWSSVALPSGATGRLDSISGTSATDMWVVGSQGFRQNSIVWHWNGTAWQEITNPIAGISFYEVNRVVAQAPNAVWLIGQYQEPGTSFFDPHYFAVTHWDSSTWEIITQFESQTFDGSGASMSDLIRGFVVMDANNMWLLDQGIAHSTHNALSANTRVMHWDGGSWQTVEKSSYPNWQAAGLDAAGPDAVWVIASAPAPFGDQQYYARHWDGTTYWQDSLPMPPPLATPRAVKVISAEDVWVVGYANGYLKQPYIVHGHLPCAEIPTAPALRKPARNSTVKLKPALRWTAADGTHYYEVQVSRKKNFSNPAPVVNTIAWTPTYKVKTVLEASKDYFWHTRACNNAGCGEWSQTRMFTTK